ncbi:MAG: hypothetical protein KatS3mg009_0527 [Acidimicrobiia bacterium]|nr:MAG: hypothetical protein KatS3mg009_0527 [Acidimicrobiia bacterium]
MPTQTHRVTGMHCDHCVRAVRDEVARLPGVEHVAVELASGLLTVTSASGVPEASVRAAVAAAGYEVVT